MSNKDNVQRWRDNTKQRMIDAMGGKCQKCGYNKCNSALEFHHIDPSKKLFELKTALERPKAWDTIVQELKKCVLLCANCHREAHLDMFSIENKQYFNDAYTTYKEDQVALTDECPVCGNEKSMRQKTCSNKCAGSLARTVDWDNINVYQMISNYGNAEQAGKHLGVTGAAVRKRAKKLDKDYNVSRLTLSECKSKFPSLLIHEESLGLDRGVNFNTLAIKIDKFKGVAKVVEYLPYPGSGLKQADFFIIVTDC